MNRKNISKILATMLVITLTFANVLLLGNYANKAYATEENLNNQSVATNNSNVEFDAYYVDEGGAKTHAIKQDINSENLQLFLYAKVTKGYLKDIKVNMFGEEEGKSTNFTISDNAQEVSTIESMDAKTNTIKLKQLDKDTQVIIKVPVRANKDNVYDIANFNKQNNIKVTAVYVNDKGEEKVITKTVKTNIEWTAQIKAVVEQEVVKNTSFNIKGEEATKGLMVQTVVRTGLENSNLPINQTNIDVKVPTIDGIKPQEVLVIANQTKATNGREGIAFNKENWNYDKETGILNINTKNEPIENKVSWDKTQKDEYIITYIFPDEVSEKITSPELEVKQNVDAKITAYGSNTQEATAKQEMLINIVEAKGEILSTTISNTMEKLSKGYLYSNVNKNIEYAVLNNIQIPYTKLVDKITITNPADNIVANEVKTPLNNYALYTQTSVNKEIFDTILGEEGYIKIYTIDGQLISTINKETTIENGNYVYNYEAQVNEVVMETSKPIAEGNLKIENKKAINCNTTYTKEQIKEFSNIETTSVIKAQYNNQEILNDSKNTTINLIEPETKIEAGINKTDLSTVVTNESVQIKTILKTNDETCMLYENPTVEVELPNFVEDIQINSVNLSYDNDLIYDQAKLQIITNANGNKVIRIPLTGKDTDYNFDNVSKGANLIIDANITLAKLTPTTNANININVVNNNGVAQTAFAQIAVNAVAPVGMVATTQISGYNARNARAMALNGQEQTLKLDVEAEARTAQVEMDIINNYNNICKNISILGQIPYQVASLNTPISLKGVDAKNVIIYYSTNENATKDLTQENGWTTATDNLAQAKSYLIVINGQEMTTGQSITANYDLVVKEKLEYNIESKLTYTVYYDNVTDEQTIPDSTVAARTTLTTGQGPELEVTMESSVEDGKEVQEGTQITYTISVKNIGKTAVEDVTVKGNVPDKTIYFKYQGNQELGTFEEYDENVKEFVRTLSSIKPGETRTVQYNVQIKPLNVSHEENNDTPIIEEVELNAIGQATVKGYEKTFTSNAIKNKVIQGYINVGLDVTPIPASVVRAEGENVQYVATIENANREIKENVVATLKLPEGLEYVRDTGNGVYDKNTNTITWKFDKLNMEELKTIIIYTKVNNLEANTYEKTLDTRLVVKTPEKQIESNRIILKVAKPALKVSLSSDTATEINVNEKIHYNIVIENIGKETAREITIEDILPECLVYEKAQYTYDGKSYESAIGGDNEAYISIPQLKPEEKIEVELTAIVENLEENEERKQVTNIVTVSSRGLEDIKSNEVKHTIINSGTTKDPSTGGEVVEGTYKISGIAWLDENKNGQRDENETKLGNVEVMLINAENGQIVKDIKTGSNKVQTTSEEGIYSFENIEMGKYIVVYTYDNKQFDLTEYRREGVTSSKNSDAISTKVSIDGQIKDAAATDIIEVRAENIYNIDIGLVVKSKFNLSLDKVITKITVNDGKNTKIYDYKDSKLAKVDLNSKTLKDTNIIVEYKIKVSNIGDVEGYAKRIVDYMPQDMKFSSELNKDWYTSNNGNLYNSSLANTVIKPGETKELTLVLTKKMTEDNTGIINNKAEIYEAYNNLGLVDEDSTPANKIETENDMSSADAVISIKTGEIPVYIGITTLSVIILAVGIYFIKKKVLSRI